MTLIMLCPFPLRTFYGCGIFNFCGILFLVSFFRKTTRTFVRLSLGPTAVTKSYQRLERNKYSEFWGRVSYITLFIGANIVFFPMHFLGLSGCPRRIPDVPNAYESLINISSIGTYILVFFLIYFVLSHVNWNRKEKKENPKKPHITSDKWANQKFNWNNDWPNAWKNATLWAEKEWNAIWNTSWNNGWPNTREDSARDQKKNDMLFRIPFGQEQGSWA